MDRADVEQTLAAALEEETGTKPDKIECPGDLKGKLDTTMECTLTNAGAEYAVELTVTTVNGLDVRFDYKVASTAKDGSTPEVTAGETMLEDRGLQHLGRGGRPTPNKIDCPGDLAGKVGEMMRCTLSAGTDEIGVAGTVTGGRRNLDELQRRSRRKLIAYAHANSGDVPSDRDAQRPRPALQLLRQGNQIIGWWDIAKVTSLYPTQATHADESYRLIVTVNERDGTSDYNEVHKSSEWEARFAEDGFKVGGEMEWHTGNHVEKSWSFQFGGLNRSSTGGEDPEVGIDPVVYSFETSRIKDPFFGWLHSHGRSHRGLMGRLFAPLSDKVSRLAFTAENNYAIFYVQN